MRDKTFDLKDGGRLAMASLPGRPAGYVVKEPAESAGHIIVARSMAASWAERAERYGMTDKKVIAALNSHFGTLEPAASAAVEAKVEAAPAPVAEILRPSVPSWTNTTPPAPLGLPERRRRERAAWIERASRGVDRLQFGRHKGKTVAEVVAVDKCYADWLQVQPWFVEKFPDLVAAIHEARGVPSREEARA